MEAENNELPILDEPINYIEPISDIDSKKWIEAMKSKINFMYTNRV
jgi:ABC-type lipopolysaccharide export system ATPase subunit